MSTHSTGVREQTSASVADPDPGSGIWRHFDPLIRDPEWVKIKIRIWDVRIIPEHPGSYFRELRNNILG